MSAFVNGKAARSGNTVTNGNSVWLHGNEIIRRENDGNIIISNCGWGTSTTKERLNGFFEAACLPYYIYQRDFTWYIRKYKRQAGESEQPDLKFTSKCYFSLREIHEHFNPITVVV